MKNDREIIDVKWGKFNFDIYRHINRQCVSFGVTLNWNFKPSIEIDFLFWRLYLEYDKRT